MADAPAPPDRHLWDQRWFRDLLLLVGAALLVMALYRLRAVLLPVAVGLVLAYAFNPVVAWLKRRLRVPRWLSTLAIMLVVGLFLLGLLLYVLPRVIGETASLLSNLPNYIERAAPAVEQSLRDLLPAHLRPPPTAPPATVPATAPQTVAATAPVTPPAPGPAEVSGLAGALKELRRVDLDQAARTVGSSLLFGLGAVGSFVGVLANAVLTVVITLFSFFYLSWRFDRLLAWFDPFIPLARRDRTLEVLRRLDRAVLASLRGRALQIGIMAVLLSVGWALAGVPYWLSLAVCTAALNLVPYLSVVGWPIAIGLTWLTTLAQGQPFDFWAVVFWPSVPYVVAQTIDGWVIEPLVQSGATELHPLSVLLAVMIGGTVGGVLGMIVAIPAAACIKILAQELLLPRLRAAARPPPP